MNLTNFLLLLVPALPLLLAIPLLRRYVPGFQYLAILPMLVMSLLADDARVELPWLLLGTGFASTSDTQILLLMSALFWIPAARLLSVDSRGSNQGRTGGSRSTFFLLTLAGYLGAVLTTELVGFFTFSMLMGYGFYGLLAYGAEQAVKRAARIYLCLIVLADLLLFEALLIAGSVTSELDFETFYEVMAGSDSIVLYQTMVLLGFSLKAGTWPLNYWLVSAFRSARSGVTILLAGVPITVAILGIVRWLPLGEIAMPELGMFISGLGVAAMVYAIFYTFLKRQLNSLTAYVTIFTTGAFTIALGAVLSEPQRWVHYEHIVMIFIVSLGPAIAILSMVTGWLQARNNQSVKQHCLIDLPPRFETVSGTLLRWGTHLGNEVLPRLRTSCQVFIHAGWRFNDWSKKLQTAEYVLQRWPVAITLLLLLGTVVVLILLAG